MFALKCIKPKSFVRYCNVKIPTNTEKDLMPILNLERKFDKIILQHEELLKNKNQNASVLKWLISAAVIMFCVDSQNKHNNPFNTFLG